MRHSILHTSANEPVGPSISMPTQWRSTKVCPRIHSSHRSSLGSRGSVSPAPSTASSSSSARSSDSRYPSRGRGRRWAGSSREQGPLSSDPTERSPICSRPRSRSPSCRPRRSGCRALGPRPSGTWRRSCRRSDSTFRYLSDGKRRSRRSRDVAGHRSVDPRLRRDARLSATRTHSWRRPGVRKGSSRSASGRRPKDILERRRALATLRARTPSCICGRALTGRRYAPRLRRRPSMDDDGWAELLPPEWEDPRP